jgi:mycothiol synthase
MRLRPPAPADAPAVLEVMTARDVADLGVPDYTLEDLRDEWGATELDLAADAVVAEDPDGTIAGYAIVRGPGTLAAVHPDREGEGIGSRLLAWAEARAAALGRESHMQWVAARNSRGAELLKAAGYAPIRSYWRLAKPLAQAPPAAAAPAVEASASAPPGPTVSPPLGVTLRLLDLTADAELVYAVNEAAFAERPDYHPESFTAFRDEHLAAHDLAPDLSRLALRDDTAVGFILCRRWATGEGYVDLLAVAPSERRRGLGTALLTAAFEAFAAAGLHEAQLGVASDNPDALRIYERAGMQVRFRIDVWERAAR